MPERPTQPSTGAAPDSKAIPATSKIKGFRWEGPGRSYQQLLRFDPDTYARERGMKTEKEVRAPGSGSWWRRLLRRFI